MMDKKGTAVEKAAVIIIFVAFLVISFVIITIVFHFSLLDLGGVTPKLSDSPAQCQMIPINASTGSGCVYNITAEYGSPGLRYEVYDNTSGLLGSYVAGESIYSSKISLRKGVYAFECNTTGTQGKNSGVNYKAGGAFELVIACS